VAVRIPGSIVQDECVIAPLPQSPAAPRWRLAVVLLAVLGAGARAQAPPAEVAVGQRLFLETRFAQFFAAHSGGDVNAALAAGDPALDTTQTLGAPLPGPYAGQSMNCAACHLVDQQGAAPGGGVRTYCDFAARSPVPDRGDGHVTTLRNAPALVDATLARPKKDYFLHSDGEFHRTPDLVAATLTGRNYGWKPDEQALAIAQVAAVIRGDDGTGALAQQSGGAYATLLLGKDPSIPPGLRLPKAYRIDAAHAGDKAVVKAVAKLIAAYVDSLRYACNAAGVHDASPYDLWLAANGLPAAPAPGETPDQYTEHLRVALNALTDPVWIDGSDGSFTLHDQPFVFGPTERDGLQAFLWTPAQAPGALSGVGNCATCHVPPEMTDFAFHNTGATQREYDALHGDGAFAQLAIPDWAARKADFNAFLRPSPKHPEALGPFASVPVADQPGLVDLGLWNVFLDPDVAAPQHDLRRLMVKSFGKHSTSELLDRTIALFKTPTVRDLGQSAPYMHNALFATLHDTVAFYSDASVLARAGQLRNADPRLLDIHLSPGDVDSLAAFLAALNEDYG
jgi:cytochrome c peroxidase